MTRYDLLIQESANFDDCYLATSLGLTREKTLGMPGSAVERDGL